MKRFNTRAQVCKLHCPSDLAQLLLLVFGIFLLSSSLALATPHHKLIKPGKLMIDGYRVTCGSTPALISDRYPDFGAARRGLIILNPVKLRRLSRGAKLLIYYHECAHQHVGGNELAADCWAVQKVRRAGLMTRSELKTACTFIKSLPANRRHPPGEMRCRQMVACYNNTFRAKADKGGAPQSSASKRALSNSGFSKPARPFYRSYGHKAKK